MSMITLYFQQLVLIETKKKQHVLLQIYVLAEFSMIMLKLFSLTSYLTLAKITFSVAQTLINPLIQKTKTLQVDIKNLEL